jgi:hypothetical protein
LRQQALWARACGSRGVVCAWRRKPGWQGSGHKLSAEGVPHLFSEPYMHASASLALLRLRCAVRVAFSPRGGATRDGAHACRWCCYRMHVWWVVWPPQFNVRWVVWPPQCEWHRPRSERAFIACEMCGGCVTLLVAHALECAASSPPDHCGCVMASEKPCCAVAGPRSHVT